MGLNPITLNIPLMKIKYTFIIFLLVSLVSCNHDTTPATTVKSAGIVKEDPHEVLIDTLGINYIMGHFNPDSHPSFTKIPLRYADREGLYLRKDALKNFIRMYDAATTEGIKLQIRSATRNFDSQKGIWERKWDGNTILSDGINAATDINDNTQRALKILEYSSMPGTSRHHWGTDIDLNSFDNEWFDTGEGLTLYNWMLAHAGKFGYCQPYTIKGESRPDGYNEEKWHWSYMPVSRPLTQEAQDKLKNEMISGFKGAEQGIQIDVVKKYVLGVNPQCK